jgi:hypothetical protein
MVKPVAGQNAWLLTDLLGRSMGMIRANGGRFAVEPEGKARETMKGMRRGPFGSLDEALAAIETHTRGMCRRELETAQAPGTDLVEPTDTSTDMPEKASADPT